MSEHLICRVRCADGGQNRGGHGGDTPEVRLDGPGGVRWGRQQLLWGQSHQPHLCDDCDALSAVSAGYMCHENLARFAIQAT